MGYTTEFQGALLFDSEISVNALKKLKTYFGEDQRDHPEWELPKDDWWNYIDLELTKEWDGIKWDGAEKSYDMVGQVNFLLREMKKEYPDFGFKGEMLAQGEEIGDVWKLVIEDGVAVKKDVMLDGGKTVKCPHCGEKFEIE